MIRFSDQVIRGAFDVFCSCRGEYFAGNAIKKIKYNSDQSHTLSSIRDTLLPKLLSGEIRV